MSGEEARTYPERIWAGHLGGGRRVWKPELAHEDEKAFACEYVRADALRAILTGVRGDLSALVADTACGKNEHALRAMKRLNAALSDSGEDA